MQSRVVYNVHGLAFPIPKYESTSWIAGNSEGEKDETNLSIKRGLGLEVKYLSCKILQPPLSFNVNCDQYPPSTSYWKCFVQSVLIWVGLQDEKSHRFLYAILFQSLSEQSDKNSLN